MYVRDSRCEARLESTGRGEGEGEGREGGRMIMGREMEKENKDSADGVYASISLCMQASYV